MLPFVAATSRLSHAEPIPTAFSAHGFFGRRAEITTLLRIFRDHGPQAVFLFGVPGVGKSSLLRAFTQEAQTQGHTVCLLDCRTIEPTKLGFQQALKEAGFDPASTQNQALCFDHYDHFILLDAWLRQEFLPSCGERLHLVFAGNAGPGIAWSSGPVNLATMRLEVLDRAAATQLLLSEGVEESRAEQILQLTKGHPLALRLALSGADDFSQEGLSDLASTEIVRHLTRYFLENIESAATREALEAASTVRRVTRPVLTEMMGENYGIGLFETLSGLPLVELRSDGLSLHPTVQEAIGGWLRFADPERFNTYRRRAWRSLQRASENVAARDLWRFTADVIFLIDDPAVREAFFPSTTQRLLVEPMSAEDAAHVLAIAELHDGTSGRAAMQAWLEALPHAFHVVRDAEGIVVAFYLLFDPSEVPEQLINADPVARAWWSTIPKGLRGQPQRVLFLRRWLAQSCGDLPSPEQAACWLDVKRAYLENRPLLRRVYLGVCDLAPFASAAKQLGFAPICANENIHLASAVLDFGRGSVDAWLSGLVRKNLGIVETITVDLAAHALNLGGTSVALTPRELAVAKLLVEASGAVVSRRELLESAWDGGYDVGSNVVDVLIRGLRKKLGTHSDVLETVRGAGYRWHSQ